MLKKIVRLIIMSSISRRQFLKAQALLLWLLVFWLAVEDPRTHVPILR